MAKILVLHGPNLNLLGVREPEIYGRDTLADINTRLTTRASEAGHSVAYFQSNAEHELVGRIHQARDEGVAFIVINPGAFTHTSIALRDALLGISRPFIEVHLSDPATREPFRHVNYLHDIALESIVGQGARGYHLALEAIALRSGGAGD